MNDSTKQHLLPHKICSDTVRILFIFQLLFRSLHPPVGGCNFLIVGIYTVGKKFQKSKEQQWEHHCISVILHNARDDFLRRTSPSAICQTRTALQLVTIAFLCQSFSFFLSFFLAVLGPQCFAGALSSCGEHGLPTVVASLVVESGVQACRLPPLWLTVSRTQAP